MADNHPLLLSLIIKNRDKIIFEDKAKAITSLNDRGVFDILPRHSNFISLIKQYVIVHKADGSKQEIPCQEGVLRVEQDLVKVYIDILPTKTTAAPLTKA